MFVSTLQPIDLETLPPAVREAFVAMQAKVAGLEARTKRQDYLIAELWHALYGTLTKAAVRVADARLPCTISASTIT